jgi:hypothetical protein
MRRIESPGRGGGPEDHGMARWMRRIGAAAAGLALGAAALGAPAAAEGDAVQAGAREAGRFDIYWGGLSMGRLDYDLSVEDGRYMVRAVAKPSGVAKLLFDARLKAEGEGTISPAPEPERFAADLRFNDDRQAVEVVFDPGGRPRSVAADPPWKPRRWEIEPTEQTGALDPMAAAAVLAAPVAPEKLCGTSVKIFDGRRVSRITLGAARPERGALRCEGAWERVAGYRPKDMKRGPSDVTVDYEVGEDGLARLERVQVDTGWGLGVALRSDEE